MGADDPAPEGVEGLPAARRAGVDRAMVREHRAEVAWNAEAGGEGCRRRSPPAAKSAEECKCRILMDLRADGGVANYARHAGRSRGEDHEMARHAAPLRVPRRERHP